MNYYKEPLLKNLYFIDPKWLCKMAAKVVGLKESNPWTRNGILDISSLQHLFRGDEFPLHLHNEYIALLEKFEVALRIGGNRLLIPSVLPETANEAICLSCETLTVSCSVDYSSPNESPSDSTAESSVEIGLPMQNSHDHQVTATSSLVSQVRGTGAGYMSRKSHQSGVVGNKGLPRNLYRIYLIPFHPSGFWPRLVSRILTDKSIQRTIKQLIKVKGNAIQWRCWRRGLCMKVYGVAVLSMEGYPVANLRHRWEDLHSDGEGTIGSTFSIEIDGQKKEIESFGGCCVEISVAPSALVNVLTRHRHAAGSANVHSPINPGIEQSGIVPNSPPAVKRQMSYDIHGHTAISPRPTKLNLHRAVTYKRKTSVNQQRANRENAARNKLFSHMAAFLLSKGVYHIDGLLEDWYEGLKSSGSIEDHSPVKRIIPCLSCIDEANSKEPVFDPNVISPDQQKVLTNSDEPMYKPFRALAQRRLQRQPTVDGSPRSLIKNVFKSSDEWVHVEMPKSSSDHDESTNVSIDVLPKSQTYSVVRYISLFSCIAHVYKDQLASEGPQTIPLCSQHKEASVSLLAPDVVS